MCLELLEGVGGIRLNSNRARLILGCLDLLEDMGRCLEKCPVRNWRYENPRSYSKLFWSCNYPTFTPEGKSFRGFLETKETAEIALMVRSTLKLFWPGDES